MKYFAWALAVLLLGVLLFSCKKSDSSTGPETIEPSPITDVQQAAIRGGYAKIKTSADSALLSASPLSAFQSKLTTYQSDTTVQSAWISGSAMFVTFKHGGTMAWISASGVAIPPYDGLTQAGVESQNCLLKPSEKIGNTKALLINAQYTDENRQYCRDLITYLTAKFAQRGFTVTTKNGTDADVSFFKSGLSGYGTIFYIAHGCYDGTNTWQVTGQEGTMDELMATYGALWQAKRLGIGGSKELQGGVWKVVNHYMFSQRFIDSLYTGASDFPSSLIYLVACQAMKDANRQVARSFNSKGARGVIGWDETNCLGQSTGKQLFNLLLCGANIRDAVRALPAEAKSDPCEVPAGANLVYYPANADTLRLVDSVRARLSITSLKPESTYTARTLTCAGSLLNGDTLASGIIEVNGVATTMAPSYASFSRPIVIDSGANYIHIVCSGRLNDGRCAFVDTTFRIFGNFNALDLWTELRWNTTGSDVDFHLLPPSGSFPSSFWTSTDCYYGSKTPTWGASLDVDNTWGYGPEHITIPTASTAGTYRLFVHYYYGNGPTSAYVTVSVRGGPNKNFGPYSLVADSSRGGDIYEVCTITYPAGTVTGVNAKRSVGALLGKTLPDPAYKRRN